MLSSLHPKMMVKLVQNNEWVSKSLLACHVNGFCVRNITSCFSTGFFGHSNFKSGNINLVVLAKSFKSIIYFFSENQLHNPSFERVFFAEHLRTLPIET